MEYKRKVTAQQEGVSGNDSEYGDLKLLARGKRVMPVVLALVMLIFALSIFSAGIEVLSENLLMAAIGVIFLLLALIQIAMITDKIEFYEYGLIDCSFWNLQKKRIAYDEIEAIVETKKRPLWKIEESTRTAFWKIYLKQKKGSIVIDAGSYVGIKDIITAVRHDTKIKNIAE